MTTGASGCASTSPLAPCAWIMASPSTTTSSTAAPADSSLAWVIHANFDMTPPQPPRPSAPLYGFWSLLSLLSLSSLSAHSAPASLSNMALYFEAAGGQPGNTTQFIARNHDGLFRLGPTEASITLRKADVPPGPATFGLKERTHSHNLQTASVHIQFLG